MDKETKKPFFNRSSGLLSIRKVDGIFHLEGVITDTSELDFFLGEPPPLKIDVSGLKGLNSFLVGRWIDLFRRWGNKPFELHSCTPEFLVFVNLIPSTLGEPRRVGSVKSLYVPCQCKKCQAEKSILTSVERLVVKNEKVEVPALLCPKCGSPCIPLVDDDYFAFMLIP